MGSARRLGSLTALAAMAVIGCLAIIPTPATAGGITITPGGLYFTVPVTSVKEARFKSVIKQQYDFSCGSAAIATLLTYHYDRPTTEQEVFKAMWEVGDQAKIQKLGFSLLDMKGYLEKRGLKADGFKVGLDKLLKVGIPAIALIDTKGYKHFVLVKGLKGGDVLIGDPALGMNVKTREDFEAMWNGIVFVVRNDIKTARENFNVEKEWQVRAEAPFGTALTRQGLANFTLLLPGRNEF